MMSDFGDFTYDNHVDFNKLTYLHLKICNTAKQLTWELSEH